MNFLINSLSSHDSCDALSFDVPECYHCTRTRLHFKLEGVNVHNAKKAVVEFVVCVLRFYQPVFSCKDNPDKVCLFEMIQRENIDNG